MSARIRRDDIVISISGKDKGKRGKVLKLFPCKNKAVVEGINMVKRHTKQKKQDQPGGIIEMEAPINLSNLMPYCPKCGRGVRIGIKFVADGKKVRICKKCGEGI